MAGDILEVQPREFNPRSIPGLTTEARDAVNAAFKAMSTWRSEIADASERNGKRVIEKMAAAATALGWPEQVTEAARTQLQGIANMQIKTMDRMMDVWEEQLKLPNAASASPSAMLSKLKSFPDFGSAAAWTSAENVPMNPLQFWMQMVEQSQKASAEVISFWTRAGRPH